MKKDYIGEYYYTYSEVNVDWSEAAVKYTLYDNHNRKIKDDMCEEHALEGCVKQDIQKVLKYKNDL